MPQTPEAPRKISRREFIRGTLIGTLGAIATACGVKPTPEKPTPIATPTPERTPTPTKAPTPTSVPSPTPKKEAPTPTPLPESVRIPEIPEYGVFSSETTSKGYKIGLLVAHLPPGKDYFACFIIGSEQNLRVFKVKESGPGTYSQIITKSDIISFKIESGKEFLKAEVTRYPGQKGEALYEFDLQFKGQGKDTVLKTMSDLILELQNAGPWSNENIEKIILKRNEIFLPD